MDGSGFPPDGKRPLSIDLTKEFVQ